MLGRKRVPFLFMIDFEMENAFASPLNEVDPEMIQYNFRGFTNSKILFRNATHL
ncbi:MAG: hypothetical protein WDN75_16630 [Bacteroidota bacterium]